MSPLGFGFAGANVHAALPSLSWYAVTTRTTVEAGTVTADEDSPVNFRHPFDAPTSAVLHLRPLA